MRRSGKYASGSPNRLTTSLRLGLSLFTKTKSAFFRDAIAFRVAGKGGVAQPGQTIAPIVQRATATSSATFGLDPVGCFISLLSGLFPSVQTNGSGTSKRKK